MPQFAEVKRLRGRSLQRMRALVRAEQPLCLDCLAKGIAKPWTELDHIISLESGGNNDRSNFQGLCRTCHLDKTARDRVYKQQGCDANGMPTNPGHHWTT